MERLARLAEILKREGISSFLFIDLLNIRYLTGFTGSSAYLLLSDGKSIFYTDFRYQEQVKKEVKANKIEIIKKNFFSFPPKELKKLKKLAFEEHSLTYRSYSLLRETLPKVKLIPFRDAVADLRIKKDEKEIDLIKKAAAITDSAFSAILNFIRPGMTEKEVARRIDYLIKEKGEVAFPTIVASGENSALPHAQPTEKKIREGEPIILDIGATFQGYASDMTRTIFLGKVPEKMKEIYQIVKKAQENALSQMKAGKKTKMIDSLARDYIKDRGYGNYFGHGLGHGVGLAVHEKPTLSPLVNDKLLAGFVVTVEPGIYLPDLGGVRIEDLVLIKEDGIEILSKSEKELLAL
ncbi:MAG: Xaa-Pro peptidase family protein [candidate division WOR-3 bacterium]